MQLRPPDVALVVLRINYEGIIYHIWPIKFHHNFKRVKSPKFDLDFAFTTESLLTLVGLPLYVVTVIHSEP